jgi:L-threonylcarbamoyladenylate synthase
MMPLDYKDYGQVLYARLREVDYWGCDYVLAEQPPAEIAWDAVRDRLERAAGHWQSIRSSV